MLGIKTVIDFGNDGIIVTAECHLSNSLPAIIIVGIANRSVDEAKERIRGALASSKIPLPRKRITINLSPADIPKEGSSFDLPILVSILAASALITNLPNDKTVVMGEVGLDGSIKPIRGIIGKILSAKKQGINNFLIPSSNAHQASLVPGINFLTFDNVSQLFAHLNYGSPISDKQHNLSNRKQLTPNRVVESNIHPLDSIAGLEKAKRALLIATAGHHNILITGPPGTGKTMLAKAVNSIMPPLNSKEVLEATHLYSLTSKNFDQIIIDRPFRSPHHTATATAILGGGSPPIPGEISLAHHGTVFMDELPEFSRQVIEALRQPLEDKKIKITRSKHSVIYSADFLLVATSNPCPCGYYKITNQPKPCFCSTTQIKNYQKKISGPILDRIDLYIEANSIPYEKILTSYNITDTGVSLTEKFRQSVIEARNSQLQRFNKLNNSLSNTELARSNIHKDALSLLNKASKRLSLSARSYMRTLRVSRTIADLDKSQPVLESHVSEALQYRPSSNFDSS